MIAEYTRYKVPPERAEEFEQAYRTGGEILNADEHCMRYEVARGVEEPEHYVVRIGWDSVEGHERGFRTSAGFADFFAAVRPFFGRIQEMKHYEVRATGFAG